MPALMLVHGRSFIIQTKKSKNMLTSLLLALHRLLRCLSAVLWFSISWMCQNVHISYRCKFNVCFSSVCWSFHHSCSRARAELELRHMPCEYLEGECGRLMSSKLGCCSHKWLSVEWETLPHGAWTVCDSPCGVCQSSHQYFCLIPVIS